jgi:hypothetical protein
LRFSGRIWLVVAFAVLVCVIQIPVLSAAGEPPAPVEPRSLALGKTVQVGEHKGCLKCATDGVLVPEGFEAHPRNALFLSIKDPVLVVDLEQVYPVIAFFVQAHHQDTFIVSISEDKSAWRKLTKIPISPDGKNLRTRAFMFSGPVQARYLKLQGLRKKGYYRISEIGIYSEAPKAWPPIIEGDYEPTGFINQTRIDLFKLLVVVAGLLLMCWALSIRKTSREQRDQALLKKIFLLTALIGCLAWWNFLFFHFDFYLHPTELFHYIIGSKYSSEVGYDGLYACSVIADAEDGLNVSHVKIRDLKTNQIIGADSIYPDQQKYKDRFTDVQWRKFKRDNRWFRNFCGSYEWKKARRDHGFNASPVWIILGKTLSSIGVVSKGYITFLAGIDVIILIVLWVVVYRVFGWQGTAVAMIFWGTNALSGFFWTGGSFLRQDWLFWTVMSIVFLKKRRMFCAGMTLAYASLLRIFPVILVAGVILKAITQMVTEKKFDPDKQLRKFLAGAVLATAILIPLSIMVTGRTAVYQEFYDNSRKHVSTSSTNLIGVRNILSYNHEYRGQESNDIFTLDPYQLWKEKRAESFAGKKITYWILLAGFILLLSRAVRNEEYWVAAVLGVGFVPFVNDLGGYYYSMLLAFGLLWERKGKTGLLLLLLSLLTLVITIFTDQYDEQYILMSIAVVLFVIIVTVDFSGLMSKLGRHQG